MRGAILSEESVIVMMAKTAMDRDGKLFPEDKSRFLELINN
jgi:hypothetical protein